LNPAGVDIYSLRSQGWTPFEYIDYCHRWGAAAAHFSELRFLGGLEPAHLRRVRDHAERCGMRLTIGMRSICPTSRLFQPSAGSAEEQLSHAIDAAAIAGSPFLRAVMGAAVDRFGPVPLEAHIENTVRTLRAVRSRCADVGIRIAVENHSGDMQARELKMLIEEAGSDFVGACIDSGNPLIALEDPHLALEILAPFVLTSHIRDTAVWATPEGAAVAWVRMGEGNIGIEAFIRSYLHSCPGRDLCVETIVWDKPRIFPYREESFWSAYQSVPAWQFVRFTRLVEKGKPYDFRPPASDPVAREREDFETSMRYMTSLLATEAAGAPGSN
jgi:sugar phosphate isomerase/epimerase